MVMYNRKFAANTHNNMKFYFKQGFQKPGKPELDNLTKTNLEFKKL